MGTKKVVIVKGSPRRNGNSAALADQAAAGTESVGAQVDVFYLHGMDIQPCDVCEACRASPEDECIVEDDDDPPERIPGHASFAGDPFHPLPLRGRNAGYPVSPQLGHVSVYAPMSEPQTAHGAPDSAGSYESAVPHLRHVCSALPTGAPHSGQSIRLS